MTGVKRFEDLSSSACDNESTRQPVEIGSPAATDENSISTDDDGQLEQCDQCDPHGVSCGGRLPRSRSSEQSSSEPEEGGWKRSTAMVGGDCDQDEDDATTSDVRDEVSVTGDEEMADHAVSNNRCRRSSKSARRRRRRRRSRSSHRNRCVSGKKSRGSSGRSRKPKRGGGTCVGRSRDLNDDVNATSVTSCVPLEPINTTCRRGRRRGNTRSKTKRRSSTARRRQGQASQSLRRQ